jgi:hypothetical protein
VDFGFVNGVGVTAFWGVDAGADVNEFSSTGGRWGNRGVDCAPGD